MIRDFIDLPSGNQTIATEVPSAPFNDTLDGIVSANRTLPLTGDNLFRCYGSSLSLSSQIGGVSMPHTRGITYRIGLRNIEFKECVRRGANAASHSFMFKLLPSMSTELQGFARKYTNFAPEYNRADYGGMLSHLVSALAYYGATEKLTWQQFLCGRPLALHSISKTTDPVMSGSAQMFIPRYSSTLESPATFAALVGAAIVSGSTVFTDCVAVDANSGAALLVVYDGYALVAGIHDAIKILMHTMNGCGYGADAAYIFTSSLHRVISVAGHSDEGAVMRDIFRTANFCPSYGAIYISEHTTYTGIPSITVQTRHCVQSLVDAIALRTAGLVALCDPLLVVKGESYPCVFSSRQPGASQRAVASLADRNSIRDDMVKESGRFIDLYLKELAHVFQVSTNDYSNARNMLTSQFCSFEVAHNRHCDGTVMAPFYWIEPTSLTKYIDNGLPANREGYGVRAGVYQHGEQPYYDKVTDWYYDMNSVNVRFKHRTARTSGFYAYHQLSPTDGLGAFAMLEMDDTNPALTGLPRNLSVRTAMESYAPMSRYLWQRGDCPLPHPAEFLVTSSRMGISGKTCEYSFDSNIVMSPIKQECDKDDNFVRYRVTRPTLLKEKMPLSSTTIQVHRARTTAIRALEAVIWQGNARRMCNVDPMTLCFVDVVDAEAAASARVTNANIVPTQGDSSPREETPAVERSDGVLTTPCAVRPAESLEGTERRGVRNAAVAVEQPDRYTVDRLATRAIGAVGLPVDGNTIQLAAVGEPTEDPQSFAAIDDRRDEAGPAPPNV